MNEIRSENLFVGSIPEIYDRLMVPMIFAEAAALLASEVSERRPEAILETAAGTGVLTEALLNACDGCAISATDLNQPMLDRAAARVGQHPRVRLQQADALQLPFDSESFDVVACQFGVMFFPDRVRGYSEALRVLRPGGALVFNTWDRLENNDFAWTTTRALEELTGVSLDFMSRVPHGYYDADEIRRDLDDAGYDVASFAAVDGVSISTAADAAVALCQGTPLSAQIKALTDISLEQATVAARDALEQQFGSGRIEGRIRSFQIVAERPNG